MNPKNVFIHTQVFRFEIKEASRLDGKELDYGKCEGSGEGGELTKGTFFHILWLKIVDVKGMVNGRM